jgi:hypothetical protein
VVSGTRCPHAPSVSLAGWSGVAVTVQPSGHVRLSGTLSGTSNRTQHVTGTFPGPRLKPVSPANRASANQAPPVNRAPVNQTPLANRALVNHAPLVNRVPLNPASPVNREVPPEQWTGLQAAFAAPVRDCS